MGIFPGVTMRKAPRGSQVSHISIPEARLSMCSIPCGHAIGRGAGRLDVFDAAADRPPRFGDSAAVVLCQDPGEFVEMFFEFLPHIEKHSGWFSKRDFLEPRNPSGALSTSPGFLPGRRGSSAITSPVAGFTVWLTVVDCESTHSPPIKSRSFHNFSLPQATPPLYFSSRFENNPEL